MHSTFKSGELIDIDSAVWNMEALQNYDYAYPDSSTKEFVHNKSYYTIPVDANNKVLMSDVQVVNGLMEDTLLYQLSQFPEEVKCMKFWDVTTDSIDGTTAYLSATSGFGLNLFIGTYYSIEPVVADFRNCYYNEPPQIPRIYSKSYHDYCMENLELTDFLYATDLIINDYNDPSNDNYPIVMILDGEGACPYGKEFVNIEIIDQLIMSSGGSTYFHQYQMTFGIPSYVPQGN